MTDKERRQRLLRLANKQESRLLARVFTEVAMGATDDELRYFDRLIADNGNGRRARRRPATSDPPPQDLVS